MLHGISRTQTFLFDHFKKFQLYYLMFSASPAQVTPPTVVTMQQNNSSTLSISVWKTSPTHVLLDWYITLAEKDNLVSCDMAHGATEDLNNTEVVENFLPLQRTLSITNLSSNTSYWASLVCKDREGGWHDSQTLQFSTGRREGDYPALDELLMKG